MPYTTQAMRLVIKEYDKVLEQERERHGIPIEYFSPMGADVHPVQLVASRMFAILTIPHVNFMSELLKVIKGMARVPNGGARWSELRITHMALLAEDKENVVFFPNLTAGCLASFDRFTQTTKRYKGFSNRDENGRATVIEENPFFPSVSSHLHTEVMEDLEDPIKSKKWLPVSRGITRLKKRQVTSMGRFLSNYLIDSRTNKPLKDSEWIETVAHRVVSFYKPPTIHRVDDILGFRRMYTYTPSASPSSCMDSKKQYCKLFVTKDYFNSGQTEVERFMSNPQAVDWYGANPNTFGIYAEKGGAVIARAICYKRPDDGKEWSSRVYAVTSEGRNSLIDTLDDMGIQTTHQNSTPGTNRDKWSDIEEDVKFSMPALNHRTDGDCAPFPYFDWYPYEEIRVKYEDGKFHFICVTKYTKEKSVQMNKDEYRICRVDDTRGYVMIQPADHHSDYCDCYSCGNELFLPDGDYFQPTLDTSAKYCSESCAQDDGWWCYITGGADHWRTGTIDSTAVWSADQIAVFSNRNNALLRGHVYLDYPWAHVELDSRKSFAHAIGYRDFMWQTNHHEWFCGSQPVNKQMLVPIKFDGERYLVRAAVAPRYSQMSNLRRFKTSVASRHSCDLQQIPLDKYEYVPAGWEKGRAAGTVLTGLRFPCEEISVITTLQDMPMAQGVDDIPMPKALLDYELLLEEMFPHGVVPDNPPANLRKDVIAEDDYYNLIGI